MLVGRIDALDIELLNPQGDCIGATPIAAAKRLAAEMLADQIRKAGLSISCLLADGAVTETRQRTRQIGCPLVSRLLSMV
jgi:hypothetical protein